MWQEKNNRNLEITTGDGVTYVGLWRSSEKTLPFNTNVFDFINKSKSFVDRRNPRSRTFDLSFVFQGEDHLEVSDNFERSSEDKRFWTVNHPLYGVIYGHPISIGFVNDFLNLTEINVEFVETIIDEVGITAAGGVEDDSDALFNQLSIDASNNFALEEIDSEMKKSISENITSVTSKYRSLYYNDLTQEVQKVIRDLNNSANAIIDVPFQFVRDLYSFSGYVSNLNTSLFAKVDFCIGIYFDFKSLVENKKYFEIAGASALASAAVSVLEERGADSFSRKELSNLNQKVVQMYSDYMTTIEDNEVEYEDQNNRFIADYSVQNNLYTIMVNCMYKISAMIYGARQERLVTLEKDSNIIVLTHRFLGLDEDDRNIEIFRNINNFKNNNLFVIKKGTKITYYT